MTTEHDIDNDAPPKVYIRDDVYSWLPAQVMETNEETRQALVKVELPREWHTTTVIRDDSSIADLEDELLLAADGGAVDPLEYSIRSTGNSSTALRTIALAEYSRYQLPLQSELLVGKRDMADLPHLHEAAILYNIKARHANRQPYTRVGDILVAMNPFCWIDSLYSDETRRKYAEMVWEKEENENDTSNNMDTSQARRFYDKLGLDPHVYEVASLAYRGLLENNNEEEEDGGGKNQTILVSGESGAGKTETVKIVLKHLAMLGRKQSATPPPSRSVERLTSTGNLLATAIREDEVEDGGQDTVRRVVETSPVFEAFGNAKTIRNDNSSRFGKFTQLQFVKQDSLMTLVGSTCVTCLLEKSRVVSQAEYERNYHIFYQFLQASGTEFKRQQLWPENEVLSNLLSNKTIEEFAYLSPSSMDEEDAVTWPQTLEALKVFHFHGKALRTLLQALMIVLQLGNITFAEDPNDEHKTVVSSRDELELVEQMMGISDSKDTLEHAMTSRIIKTNYETVQVQLKPAVAKESCNALAKEMYARIFDRMVRCLNDYTKSQETQQSHHSLISMLDIFGFERFQVNRFEQLCINYANEQLQHKYVHDMFAGVKAEYEAEGLDVFDLSKVDNVQVLNLLDGRVGVLDTLTEECVRPNGNDESFVYKLKIVHHEHDCLLSRKLHRRTEFGIRHVMGPVTYDATDFVKRNTDKLPVGLIQCASTSSNDIVKEEFRNLLLQEEQSSTSKSPKKKHTVLAKFRGQLRGLLQAMQDSHIRYIRCIKPNESTTPRITDHAFCMRQMQCAGLVTAIAITREIFPSKMNYDDIAERFSCLMRKNEQEHPMPKNSRRPSKVRLLKTQVHDMLVHLLMKREDKHKKKNKHAFCVASAHDKPPFACGETRVFFRAGELEKLEVMRLEYYTKAAVVLQSWFRKRLARVRYLHCRKCAVFLQARLRGYTKRHFFSKQRAGAVMIARWYRGCIARRHVAYLKRQASATIIQCFWRKQRNVSTLDKYRQAAVIIQTFVRTCKSRNNISSNLALLLERVQMDQKLNHLLKKVARKGQAFPKTTTTTKAPPSRAVEENVFQDMESVLEYCKKEITTLRKDHVELKTHVQQAEDETRALKKQVENAEASAMSAKMRVNELTKRTSGLVNVIVKHKREALDARQDMRNSVAQGRASLATTRLEFDKTLAARDREILKLRKQVKRLSLKNDEDHTKAQEDMLAVQEKHVKTVKKLKENLRHTQESHHAYLLNLMEVLEKTHGDRQAEMTRISTELEVVKKEKDGQIAALQKEVAMLRKNPAAAAPAVASPPGRHALSSMRDDLERNHVARAERGKQFMEVCQHLEASMHPSNLVKVVERGEEEVASSKFKKMIHYLNDLYSIEEMSQAQSNRETLEQLQQQQYGGTTADEKLQAHIQRLSEENEKLKQQVKAKDHCSRCAARLARREKSRAALEEWSSKRGGLGRSTSGGRKIVD